MNLNSILYNLALRIEKEVNSLLEEINEWNDTKPLKEAKGNACKEVEALRESRLKLHKRKLDFKR
jgi:hypothetical protein